MREPTHSTEPVFTITTLAELSALQRALQVALRCDDADDPAVVGSPIVAALAHRAVDAMIEADRQRGRDIGRWRSWRQLESRPNVLDFVERRKASMPDWGGLELGVRRTLVESWIAPFVADATLLDALVGV